MTNKLSEISCQNVWADNNDNDDNDNVDNNNDEDDKLGLIYHALSSGKYRHLWQMNFNCDVCRINM